MGSCPAPKAFPAAAGATQADVAAAWADTYAAWESCNGRLKRLRDVAAQVCQ